MIDRLVHGESMPALEGLMRFAGARHRVLVHDIANLDTPDFRPVDLSVDDFRAAMREAIAERDDARSPGLGRIETDDLVLDEGGIRVDPRPIGANLLFHDGNDRDPERIVQSLVENFMTFRAAADLLRSRMALIETAINGRI